jgi:succinate dehydrogenase/fumarate reductase flavoprotein subunit
MTGPIAWPYPVEFDVTEHLETDVLVVGGGGAGCFAAIGAADRGARVIMLEKASTLASGSSGSGTDHWESAATNPCSRVTPEELVDAMIRAHRGYNNGISHYIECREGWDRLLDIEAARGKIRDTEDEFAGADFRDEATKLLFAYDYQNRFMLRVWGQTFKPAMLRACKRRHVRVIDRTMVCGLLTEGGRVGARVVGAVAVNGRTGKFTVVRAKATVMCTSRPTRVWLFVPGAPGISEFRPPQCTGDGHAIGWQAGVAFTMLEKAIRAEWSGTRSFPPYGTGNNHNSWYACSMVDAEEREIPWVDRDGRELKTVAERYRPAPGQRLFLKGGGEPDFPIYEFLGPDTLPTDELLKRGYKLPFYADLTRMPEMERRVIWGVMLGNEGKTKIPVFGAYTKAGFDPARHLLQSYGDGWKSGAFLPQERQFFGLPGGMMNDWHLMTNLEGLFAAGDILFASNCDGHAAATGHYAGRHAAAYAARAGEPIVHEPQVVAQRSRLYRPLANPTGLGWQELNLAIARVMQHHCGEFKTHELLTAGLEALDELETRDATRLTATTPHDLIRAIEVMNILTTAQLVLHSCLARKASSKELAFNRLDYPELDPPAWSKFVTVRQAADGVHHGTVPLDYYGNLPETYERENRDYIESRQLRGHRRAS